MNVVVSSSEGKMLMNCSVGIRKDSVSGGKYLNKDRCEILHDNLDR